MENASKALIMVASVLIGIMLLSVMIYVFRAGAKVNEAYDNNQISNQLELYNSKFEYYDKDNNTIVDMITLANLAYDVNSECDYDVSSAVRIKIVIGNEEFIISNTDKLSSRNKIFHDGSEISIYDLNVKTLHELGVTPTSIKEKSDLPTNISNLSDDPKNTDLLSTTKLVKGKTVYKYLFEVENPEDFSYNQTTARVSEIILHCFYNPVWDNE